MSTFHTIWDGLDWSVLTDILLAVIPALLCITLHELAHGYVAYRLGDDTAKRLGRLTLNPIKHIDPMGLIMMVVFHFGWAKPVPVNMNRFEHPKRGMAITAAAGPLCNLLLTCVLLLVYGFVYTPMRRVGGTVCHLVLGTISTASYLSLALAIFNILPIPPLDGSKVLFSLLPETAYDKLMRYERFGMILLLLIVATDLLGSPLSTATEYLYSKLFTIAQWSFDLGQKLF